jgi:hypothetical protein
MQKLPVRAGFRICDAAASATRRARQSGVATGKYGITANRMQRFGENHVSVSVRPLCMRLGSARGKSRAWSRVQPWIEGPYRTSTGSGKDWRSTGISLDVRGKASPVRDICGSPWPWTAVAAESVPHISSTPKKNQAAVLGCDYSMAGCWRGFSARRICRDTAGARVLWLPSSDLCRIGSGPRGRLVGSSAR